MKKMLKMVLRYWPFALLASLFMVAEVFIDLVQPKLMEIIVDNGILGLDRGGVSDVGLIISTGIRMITVVAFGGLAGILSAVFANVTGQNYGNDLRKACFTKIMHFSFAQTDKFSTGSLITRITNDITQVQQLVMQLIRGLVRCLMFFIGGTSALLSLDLSFGVIVACAFPLIILNVSLVVWKTNPLFNLLQSSLDKLNNIMQENVSGARVVKAFVQEKTEQKKFEKANDNLVNTQFKVQIMLSLLRPVMNIVLNLAVVGIILVGSIRVQSGSIAPGTVMAAITYISQILSGMMMLAMIFQTLSRGSVSAKRIAEVLNTDSEIQDGKNSTIPVSADKGTISFKNVSFSYPGTNTTVLKNINLDIQAGQTLGIIGATGSGKTTLINLIPRFYDATGGSVTVDGIDVKDYKLETLRKKISLCLQKSELFSTTIRDNIAMGKEGAAEEEIRAAAQSAQAEEFILQQTGGYDTPVAERGMSLSGGQRQRIAISRALLKQGEILIFDDSTSALDLKTESQLYQALNSNYKGITKIIIAQRIASVKNADKIAVLDGGSICAIASHEELLKTCPVYQDIYDSQLKQTEGGRA
ncbi:MAG: ABC transporter ATP-binding protein/permease [Treponema sp.]|nr:ABC transporter ATP-binding protein/permease [Treponema sp.]